MCGNVWLLVASLLRVQMPWHQPETFPRKFCQKSMCGSKAKLFVGDGEAEKAAAAAMRFENSSIATAKTNNRRSKKEKKIIEKRVNI